MLDLMPAFIDQTVSEADSGALTWLMGALDHPDYGAEIYGYGTIIGTGNAVAGWFPDRASGTKKQRKKEAAS